MTASGAPASSPLTRLVRSEAFPGLLLVFAAFVAILAANLPWAAQWETIWQTELRLRLGTLEIAKPVQHWINDGLMVLFFFYIGLEIKHEVLDGQLQSLRQATLPIAAAVGGMAVPAVLYSAIVTALGDDAALSGWGIPMATDIAFALGVLALLGRRVPAGLKVFLATLAIVDDLGAVIVIALFYTERIAWHFLVAGVVVLSCSLAANRLGVRKTWPYVVFGLLLWLLFLQSGVHATIAGVALALTIPARRRLDEREFLVRGRELLDEIDRHADPTPMTNQVQLQFVRRLQLHATDVQAPLQRMEHGLSALVAHLIVPLFALANAGVAIGSGLALTADHAAARGVFFGLVLGKPVGVLLACWLAVRLFGSPLPLGTRWPHLHGAAWLSGIGFTMALFIDGLAFHGHGEAFHAAKVAILAASALTGVIGFVVLLRAGR